MAFDQSTRNRLQKFVSESRRILTEEFTRQLQATYGLDPKSGSIAELDSLTDLDNNQRQTANILRETLSHYILSIHGKSEKDRIKEALDRIIREQAFTVLNRLCALRMAEARGFLLESIAKDYNSKGFQLYKNLAGTALGETGDAYRCYLFSLFDEFGIDLAVLFDRHSSQGRLFPRESSLLALLEEVNHFEIEQLWAEDETIGWIYQYFNSLEERKKMRAESQAPRNSRELAVRNQFFTPRYVVEFLTDNTLGRIWYEMTQGKTSLVDSCRYLVRRPTEIFLAKGEKVQGENDENSESLSHEELLKQPVYIPFRQIKDPRELRMLDPACGSMHFGLYAFDLFERIYEESWQLEEMIGHNSFERSKELKSLHQTYSSFDEFKIEIPRLIIENNIHGVDIDPRAVQIAGLSLWQRAQRSWHQMGIKPNQRPTIKKSNIVCAEPMPGEKEMLREFTANLNPPVLGQLVETIFDKMELAGEAGTLLKIEEEIKTAIDEAKDAFNQEILRQKKEKGFLRGMAPERETTLFDFAELPKDTKFWDTAEQRILDALSDYANQADSNEGQKRLFAEDAARGFAFIDLCRKRYDVVLMNPPFGEPSENSKNYCKKNYNTQVQDLYCLFVDRAVQLNESIFLGAITSSSFLKYNDYSKYRAYILSNNYLDYLLELGWDVLDDAYVSASAYFFSTNINKTWLFSDLRFSSMKDNSLLIHLGKILEGSNSPNLFVKYIRVFDSIDSKPFCYSFTDTFFSWVKNAKKLIDITENNGIGAGPHNFFFRLNWEVDAGDKKKKNRWPKLVNGGQFSPFYRSVNLVIDWRENGDFIKEHLKKKYPYLKGNVGIKIQRENMYFKPGITYGKKTNRFNAQIMLADCIPSFEGVGIYPKDESDTLWLLSYLNSRFTAYYLNLTAGLHKNSIYLDRLPIPEFNEIEKAVLSDLSKQYIDTAKELSLIFEIDNNYDSDNAHTIILQAFTLTDFLKYMYRKEMYLAVIIKESEDLINSKLPLNDTLINEIVEDQGTQFLQSAKESKRQIFTYPRVFGGSDLANYLKESTEMDVDGFFLHFSESEEKAAWFKNYLISWALGKLFKNSEDHDIYSLCSDNSKFLSYMVCSTVTHNYSEFFFSKMEDFNDVCLINQSLSKVDLFFDYHYREYSLSGRNAPVYWSLQTPSCSYTIWVYYHRLTEQTLYTCINDFVDPKLKTVTDDLNGLRNKSARSTAEEKEYANLLDFEAELKDFRDELLRIAKFWKPNLNDGVQITAAPLWKLFQHKPWQKKLKETWEAMEKGEYDWAHLSYSIWPERVLRKCHKDRSLAIAHDVEDDFWEEVEVPAKGKRKNSGEIKTEWHPKKLSGNELNDLIRHKISEMKTSH